MDHKFTLVRNLNTQLLAKQQAFRNYNINNPIVEKNSQYNINASKDTYIYLHLSKKLSKIWHKIRRQSKRLQKLD